MPTIMMLLSTERLAHLSSGHWSLLAMHHRTTTTSVPARVWFLRAWGRRPYLVTPTGGWVSASDDADFENRRRFRTARPVFFPPCNRT
jgi:hypothetical protein